MSTTIGYFARHGETTLNASNCFRGPANPPLNENGVADAHKLADFFDAKPLSVIFYSDKLRSSKTAEVIGATKPDIRCLGTPALHAWNVGTFSGKQKNAENVAKLDFYIKNPSVPIPNGESLNDFKARVQPCILEALEVANKAGTPMLCVVHSSIIHEVGSLINGHPASTLVLPGGVAEVYTENGKLRARPVFKVDRARLNTAEHADTVS